MQDTLGSVGVIISTLLIQFYGWTGFDPIASLFIAVLIAASVIPLVVDTGRVLALDVSDRGTSIQQALSEVNYFTHDCLFVLKHFYPVAVNKHSWSSFIQLCTVLAKRRNMFNRVYTYPTSCFVATIRIKY
jgi:solute carrier family 30 (zinc transporter), member 5/7